MALTYSTDSEIGSAMVNFELNGTDGEKHSPERYGEKELLVIIFMCNHCPYVKAITSRLASLHKKYHTKGVQIIGINPNDPETYPEDSFENMKKFATEHEFEFPYLVDDTQEVARAYDAVCTPDIYLYDQNRKLKYRGRLDDNWKEESLVQQRDLEKAIELLLAKKEIDFEQIPSMGCSIKWKN